MDLTPSEILRVSVDRKYTWQNFKLFFWTLTLTCLFVFFVGLRELSIRNCPLVTPEGILPSLHFPLLRRFHYVAPVRVSTFFVVQILSQNRNLKTLVVNLVDPCYEVLKQINKPRLTLIDPVIISANRLLSFCHHCSFANFVMLTISNHSYLL